MDVRCEKCQTEYELDEAKVTEAGVTVKCTTCGNLFKIRKRAQSQAVPMPVPESGGGERLWLIRNPQGEIQRFRELTTLQQWIVEQKVNRECEISRTGETWKRLGDIAELASFFMVVEQAQAKPERTQPRKSTLPFGGRPAATPPNEPRALSASPAPAPPTPQPQPPARPVAPPAPIPPAITAKPAAFSDPTAPLPAIPEPPKAAPVPRPSFGGDAVEPSGPIGGLGASTSNEPAWAGAGSAKANRAALGDVHHAPSFSALNRPDLSMAGEDFDAYQPPKSKAGWFALVILLLGGAAFALYWFALRPKSQTVAKTTPPPETAPTAAPPVAPTVTPVPEPKVEPKVEPKIEPAAPAETAVGRAYREGLEKLHAEDLDAAERLFEQGRGGTPVDEARALASLALIEAIRADWAAVDAAAIKSSDRKKAKALEADAAKRLARADKLARDAQVEDPKSVEAALALAEVKRQQKRKAADVERHLAGLDHPEAHYVRGRLRARDGKTSDAHKELTTAAEKHKAQTGKEHFRARWHLAALHVADKRWADAKTEVALLTGQRATWLADEIARQEALAKPPASTGGSTPKDDDEDMTGPVSADAYDGLVERADKLAEAGKCGDAKKVYERALDARPGGVEALVGLGYCYLDGKDYARAIANFRAALGISPRFGDALIGIAEAHRFSGNKDEALKYYQKYLDAHPAGKKAGLARRGIDTLGGGGASTPTPPPADPPKEEPPKQEDPPKVDPPKEAPPPEPAKPAEPAPTTETKTETPP